MVRDGKGDTGKIIPSAQKIFREVEQMWAGPLLTVLPPSFMVPSAMSPVFLGAGPKPTHNDKHSPISFQATYTLKWLTVSSSPTPARSVLWER